MPYLQRRRLVIDTDLDAQSTWRYKLPAVGAFTAFMVVVEAQREAQRAVAASPISIDMEVTKIEILEGGTRPLISLTGQQIDALNYWDFGHPVARKYRQEDATWNGHTFFLMGGRSLYDQEYGYDMSRLGETYIEVTHDMIAAVAEGFDEETARLRIYGYQWMGDGVPLFKGYFRSRQLAYWTTSDTDIIKVIPIPVGNPVRRVAVQACTRASTLGGTVKEYELVVNDGEYSPVHIRSAADYVQAEVAEYDLENELGGIDYCLINTAMDLPFWFSYYQDVLVNPYGLPSVWPRGPAFMTAPAYVIGNAATAGECTFTMRGWGFQKCLRIGFDHMHDGSDLLQTYGLGALDLICTEANSARAARVFVQDVLTY